MEHSVQAFTLRSREAEVELFPAVLDTADEF